MSWRVEPLKDGDLLTITLDLERGLHDSHLTVIITPAIPTTSLYQPPRYVNHLAISTSLYRHRYIDLATSTSLYRLRYIDLTTSTSIYRPRYIHLATLTSLHRPRYIDLAITTSLHRPYYIDLTISISLYRPHIQA